MLQKRNIHTEDTTSHGEKKRGKKKRNQKTGRKKQEEKKRGADYRTRELRRYDSLMVLPPTLQRHEFAQSIHATFLYPTARLPPLFDAVVVCRCSGGDYRWVVCCKIKRYIQRTPPPMEKKKGKKKMRCRVRVYRTRELRLDSLMVSPPAPQRH